MTLASLGMDSTSIIHVTSVSDQGILDQAGSKPFDVLVASPRLRLVYEQVAADESAASEPRLRGLPTSTTTDLVFISRMLTAPDPAPGGLGVIIPVANRAIGLLEKLLRQQLVEENLIDAVIALPTNLFIGGERLQRRSSSGLAR